jgi:hypothetical protein
MIGRADSKKLSPLLQKFYHKSREKSIPVILMAGKQKSLQLFARDALTGMKNGGRMER